VKAANRLTAKPTDGPAASQGRFDSGQKRFISGEFKTRHHGQSDSLVADVTRRDLLDPVLFPAQNRGRFSDV
jgi:hypothetical protein